VVELLCTNWYKIEYKAENSQSRLVSFGPHLSIWDLSTSLCPPKKTSLVGEDFSFAKVITELTNITTRHVDSGHVQP